MLTRARDHSLRSKGSIGSGFKCRFVDGPKLSRAFRRFLRNGRLIQLVEQFADGQRSVLRARRTSDAAAPPRSSAGPLAQRFRLWLCPSACTAARARCRSRSAARSCIGRVQIRIVAMRLGHAGLGVIGNHQRRDAAENVRRRARGRAATIPSADRAWPRPRCSCWRPARPRTTAPAKPGRVCRS
jgi:hypothetical protein